MTWRGADAWQPYEPPSGRDAKERLETLDLRGERAEGQLPEDEGDLWRHWRLTADATAHGTLVKRYMPFAKRLAGRIYARRPHDEIQFDEYEQFAMVGLLESIERYAPEAGAAFRTFAFPRIQGAILNGLARLTERQQQMASRRRIASERTGSFAPEPLSLERTEELLSELGEIGVGIALGFILEGAGPSLELQSGPSADPYEQCELRQIRQQMWQMVGRLSERERGIIEMHYKESRRFEEIARAMGLGKSRVSQLHRQAILQLRALISKAERCDVSF